MLFLPCSPAKPPGKQLDLQGSGRQLRACPIVDVRRSRLAGIPGSHVWPVQQIVQGERAAYLVRQHLIANLFTRVSTRPFLTYPEKVL